MIPADTDPEAYAVQTAVYRRLTDEQRMAQALKMSAMLRDLALCELRVRNPGGSEAGVRRELLRQWYPDTPFPGDAPRTRTQ